jgi:acetyl-CoA/propionyl-CoA carboxylase biotin carboxyl carrier protein
VIRPAFGALLAKLVVTGATRAEAIDRARRALAAFDVTGLPTGLPFLRRVVADEAFAPADPARPFTVHTRWLS